MKVKQQLEERGINFYYNARVYLSKTKKILQKGTEGGRKNAKNLFGRPPDLQTLATEQITF